MMKLAAALFVSALAGAAHAQPIAGQTIEGATGRTPPGGPPR